MSRAICRHRSRWASLLAIPLSGVGAAALILMAAFGLTLAGLQFANMAPAVPVLLFRAYVWATDDEARAAGCVVEKGNLLAGEFLRDIVMYDSLEDIHQCMARARKEGRLAVAI